MIACLRTVGVPPEVRDRYIRPSHEVFDAWIATPDRDRLTASDVHQAVSYQPIIRYDIAGGYLNHQGLTAPPGPSAPQETP